MDYQVSRVFCNLFPRIAFVSANFSLKRYENIHVDKAVYPTLTKEKGTNELNS